MSLKLPHPRLKRLGQQPVVSVQKHQVFSPGVADACVARPRKAPVLLANAAHPGITSGYLRGVVGRAIVYHDYLESLIALGEDALYRFAEEVGLVVAGNNHRDQRRTRALFSSEVVGIPPLVVILRHSPSTLLLRR